MALKNDLSGWAAGGPKEISGAGPGRPGDTTRCIPPPPGYRKKIVNPGESLPLSETYTGRQIETRVAFYRELNDERAAAASASPEQRVPVHKRFALYGWEDTTTVRVYMRETVSRIAAQLFTCDYSLSVQNIKRRTHNGKVDKDHGYVVVDVSAAAVDVENLLARIGTGSSYLVYDGEEEKYVPGDTGASEFIITRPGDALHPPRFWRRSHSFVSWCSELPPAAEPEGC
jgi:hypothetical protein